MQALSQYIALTAPRAQLTREVSIYLSAGDVESDRVQIEFPRPVEIVGFEPTLVDVDPSTGLIVPTLDDVLVSIDSSLEERPTASVGFTAPGGGSGYVTLSTISARVPRLWGWELRDSRPVIGFQLRWKLPGTRRDALVGIAAIARYL